MLAYYFRETFAGRTISILSGGRILPVSEPQLPKQWPNTDALPDARHDSGLKDPENRNSFENSQRSKDSSHCDHDSQDSGKASRQPSVEDANPAAEDLKEAKNDAYIVTFNDSDVENPHNWPTWLKCWTTAMICLLTFSIYIGASIYTSGIDGVSQHFHVSRVVATLGLSLYVFGYAVGPMFLAPLSEAPPLGRSPMYVITHLIFLFLNFGVVYATNIGMLLAFRFLTGFFGSPVLATGGASLADMWSPRTNAYMIILWALVAVCGPLLGPLLSGFAVMAKGWQWSIWILIWLNALCAVLIIFTMPETSSANILFRRAVQLKKKTGESNYKTEVEVAMAHLSGKDFAKMLAIQPFQLLLTEPILIVENLYLGLVYSVLYCWFDAIPLVFGTIYGFNLGEIGLSYLGTFIGVFPAFVGLILWIRYVLEPQADANGCVQPEKRISATIFGSFWIPICLFWFGWTSRPDIPWIVPIIGSGTFFWGCFNIFLPLIQYQVDAYPKYVGAVLAGQDLFRSMMAGAFPLFATAMYEKIGIDWGCSLLAFISILFIPMFILLRMYGKRLRMMSKFARHDI